MKTITIDYETYEKELDFKFKEGANLGTNALQEAKKLLEQFTNTTYTYNFKNEVHKWLMDYGNL